MPVYSLDGLSPETLGALAITPVGIPPVGTTSNFVNPQTRAGMQLWTTGVFGSMAMVFYLNRVYIKARLMKKRAWDELTLFITVLISIMQYSSMTYSVTRGVLGRHIWDVSIAQAMQPSMAITSFYTSILTPLSLMFLKATFFVLYIHLFSRIRWIRICSWAGLIYSVVTHAGMLIYLAVVTNPRENQSWGQLALKLGVPFGAVGLVSDAMIFVIPFAAIIPLELSTAKKIGACLMFLTGGSAVICSALSIYYRYELENSVDPMWDAIPGLALTLCEVYIGIICACIPTIAFGFKQQGSIYQRVFLGRGSVIKQTKVSADSVSHNSRWEINSQDAETTEGSVRTSAAPTVSSEAHEEKMELKSLESGHLDEPKTEEGIQPYSHTESV